ncbi:MAG: hypothetical protein WC069_06275 [Candidatus Shapirobacteria bacterium]
MERSDIAEMLEKDGCVVCGDECEGEYLLCHSCNAHEPGGAGWKAADASDLKNVKPEHREEVMGVLNEDENE